MANHLDPGVPQPDSAAVFGAAISLWTACHNAMANDTALNLSDTYNGMDELMRVVMRIAEHFEKWCCLHVAFEELGDVWPYMLEDRFGEACLSATLPTGLGSFDETDCLRVAIHLPLAIKVDDTLPIPLAISSENPVPFSPFRMLRLQTVRNRHEDSAAFSFTEDDEPFDEEFGVPFYTLYGVLCDDTLAHIADRRSYAEAARLARALSPGIVFPECPTFSPKRSGAR